MVSQKLLRRTGSMGWMEGSRIVGTLSANTNPTTAKIEPAGAKCLFRKINSKIRAKTVIPKVTQMRDSYILETGGRPDTMHRRVNPKAPIKTPPIKTRNPGMYKRGRANKSDRPIKRAAVK